MIDEVFQFLESRDKYGSQPGLERIQGLLELLGNPEDKIETIHIAGTNGKGSVGAYLESIFQQAGQCAFHFSSPAVFDRKDPWRRRGEVLSDELLEECTSRVQDATKQLDAVGIHPTRFEIETALALHAAAYLENDILILETGMGGLHDATNVMKKTKKCVFTNISYDHMQFLGETLTEIATEKAGIIKPGCKVFSAEQELEVKNVLDETVKSKEVVYVDNTALELISQKPGELQFRYKGETYVTSLSGLYQMKNAALAIEVAKDMGYTEKIIKDGIKEAKWEGRFQVLSKNPYFIIDGAHNVDAIKQLAQTIEKSFTNESINFIIGVLKDKEHEKMMEIIAPMANRIFTVTPKNARGMDGGELAEEIRKWHKDVTYCESIETAVFDALNQGKETGCATVAFGSLSYLSEVRKCHDNYYKK